MDEKQFLNGRKFEADGKIWRTSVENDPAAFDGETDRRCVMLLFGKDEEGRGGRRLRLCLSHALFNDPTKNYRQRIEWRIQVWLSGAEQSEQLALL